MSPADRLRCQIIKDAESLVDIGTNPAFQTAVDRAEVMDELQRAMQIKLALLGGLEKHGSK